MGFVMIMIEKLGDCPKCRKPLTQFEYDMQQCKCGWNAMGIRPERLPRDKERMPRAAPRTTIPHDPAERERARYKPPDEYTRHLEGACGLLAQGVPLTEELLASIAISLKRIADQQYNHTAITNILDRAHAALRTVDCNLYLDGAAQEAAKHGTALRVTDAINAIEEFARERKIKLSEFK